jgi:hypothetical protein
VVEDPPRAAILAAAAGSFGTFQHTLFSLTIPIDQVRVDLCPGASDPDHPPIDRADAARWPARAGP